LLARDVRPDRPGRQAKVLHDLRVVGEPADASEADCCDFLVGSENSSGRELQTGEQAQPAGQLSPQAVQGIHGSWFRRPVHTACWREQYLKLPSAKTAFTRTGVWKCPLQSK
jgi:hypothetical protein